jgi:CheY-like chemotaxis protein
LPASQPPALIILVVDDNDAVRRLTSRVLADDGYAVITAMDGVDALAVLDDSPGVAAIVADLKMPRMDGHELALQVGARWPGVRMLFMTGHPDASLMAGLPGPLILKPYAPDALTAAVRALLNGGAG